ncbi:MAG: type II secretion system protein, partial [Candidatus Magasanikbacteria bacterium]|nr:type II secretion system protein [Candidatus Magasanikbacteria bacterium]
SLSHILLKINKIKKKKMKLQKGSPRFAVESGFTLIELLVVIAIIGLLATIALASLNSARRKSADAAVKANMANISAQGELYYDTVGDYGAIDAGCTAGMFSDPNITAMVTAAGNSAGTPPAKDCSTEGAQQQKWAILIGPLKGDATNRNWCIDSSGVKGFTATLTTSAGGCPADTSST